MSWAREIFTELLREEASAALEEDVWYECEEWPRGEFGFEDFDEKVSQSSTQEDGDEMLERGGRNDAKHVTDITSLGQQTTIWTRGELVGPIETGISSEAAMDVAAASEGCEVCFLCGATDCDCECEEGRDWGVVWFLVVAMCEMAASARWKQRVVTRWSTSLRAGAKVRKTERSRKRQQKAEDGRRWQQMAADGSR